MIKWSLSQKCKVGLTSQNKSMLIKVRENMIILINQFKKRT